MNRQPKMNCATVQQHLDDLARDRLSEPQATLVRHHLTDCTDCRVLQQRNVRLQRLLALKRYEQPAPAYFDNFLAQFHQRLDAVEAHPTFWQRFLRDSAGEPLGLWRLGLAGVCGLALCVSLVWMGLRSSHEAVLSANQLTTFSTVRLAEPTQPSEIGSELLLRHIPRANSGELLALDTVAIAPAPPPRYVLDRIAITPASYDVMRADF
jgi:hypothetical protein